MGRISSSILLGVLVSCGGGSTSPSEPELSFKGATPAEEVLGYQLLEEQKACYGFKKQLTSFPIRVLGGAFFCGTTFANGCTLGYEIQVNRKTYEDALSHEFIHLFDFKTGRAPDYQHSGEIWKRCDKRNTPS